MTLWESDDAASHKRSISLSRACQSDKGGLSSLFY